MTRTGGTGGSSPLDLGLADLRARLERHHHRPAGSGHDPGHDPGLDPGHDRGGWQAATALVVAPHDPSPAIAFIRRTERGGDRWSGHMALPGGKRDDRDPDLAATAAREAREEVGIQLRAPTTRLPDQRGRTTGGRVATFVHVLDERPQLVPDPREVAEALWIPIDHLVRPSAAARIRWNGLPFPAIEHDGRVIWGLTLRILGTFMDAVDLRLPRRGRS